jgi:UDP:flavonoid glycosyltransferase YjiC (YdhE family)
MGVTKKILFVVGPALGHVGRSLVIARALAKQSDVKIHFACVSPGYGEKIIGSEFQLSSIAYKRKGGRTFAANLEQLMTLESPDLICLDLTPVPWLYQVVFPPVPQVYITNFFLTRLGEETTVQDLWFEKNSKICNLQRMSRGLEPIKDVRDLYERDVVLLADPFSLMNRLGEIPTNYLPVGPCVWEPVTAINNSLGIMQNILYISMGSSGNRTVSLGLIEALADCIDASEIIWVGKRNIIADNCSSGFSCQYFDQLSASTVIPKAKLVITQGGAGSTYQALGYGVPTLIWPTHENHRVLGGYMQKNGFGLLMTEDLQACITQLCSNIDIYRQNIIDAGSQVSFETAPYKASKFLLEYIGGNN